MESSEWTVGAEEGLRLDKFLAAPARLGSRARAFAAIERGQVFINGVEAQRDDAARRLLAQDLIRVWRDRPGSARNRPRPELSRQLRIVHEDESLVVVDKPPGLLTVPPEDQPGSEPSVLSLLAASRQRDGRRRPLVVHRIDQQTSGLVVFATSPAAQSALKVQFARRLPERVYLAIVRGHPHPPEATWRDLLVWDERAFVQKGTHPNDPRGVEAISTITVVERLNNASLVEVRLQTGRRNQIRAQARLRGHALVGDSRYTPARHTGEDGLDFPRQALHAHRLSFVHPATGRQTAFESPLPDDMRRLMDRLRQ